MISDFFDTTVTVRQISTSTNPMGGVVKTFSTRITSLKCRIGVKNISETDEYGKMTVRSGWRMYCEASSTNRAITESDRISYGSETYEVVGVANPAMQNHHLEVDLVKVI